MPRLAASLKLIAQPGDVLRHGAIHHIQCPGGIVAPIVSRPVLTDIGAGLERLVCDANVLVHSCHIRADVLDFADKAGQLLALVTE